MPGNGTTAVVNGKKTLSDSEVQAYSKNRFADRSLHHTVRQLRTQKQVCHDRHQREIFQWKDFMRQSTRTSGVWFTSFDSESDEDNPESPPVEHQHNDVVSGTGGGFTNSSLQRDNSCPELARSTTFQSEPLSRLQKPWAYTYSATSHNTVYNEAMQLAQGQERRLFFRRTSSNSSATSSSSDQQNEKDNFRSRSTVSDLCQDPHSASRRPLTGRSTPGVALRSPSRDRLTAAASVHKERPKTTVGLVRVKYKSKKTAWGEKDNSNTELNSDVNNKNNVDRVPAAESVRSPATGSIGHENGRNVPKVVFDSATGKEDGTAVSTENAQVSQNGLSVGEGNRNGIVTDEKREPDVVDQGSTVTDNSTDVSSLLLADFDTHALSQMSSAFFNNHNLKVSDNTGNGIRGNTSAQSRRRTNAKSPTNSVGEKRVQINLAASEKQTVDEPQAEADTNSELKQQSSQTPVPPKNRKVTPLSDGLKEDGNGGSPVSISITSRQSESHAENKWDNQRPKSVTPAANNRRGSGGGSRYSGQRSDMTSVTSNSLAMERGSLSRRYSAIDERRRGSFLKIVDQLEALREHSNRRLMMMRTDQGPETRSPQTEVSAPLNEANANSIQRKEATEGEVKGVSVPRSDRSWAGISAAAVANSKITVQRNPKDKAEDASAVAKTTQNFSEHQPTTENGNRKLSETPEMMGNKPAAEHNPEQSHYPDTDENYDDPDSLLTDRSASSKDSSYTSFRGFKIRNYVRPQERYRGDPFLSSRRERSLARLSLENPVCLNGNRGDSKSEMIFPKTARQKVLQELVDRNHQPPRTQDIGVVPPELRAKIDDFFKTIEPYCPKPELVLD